MIFCREICQQEKLPDVVAAEGEPPLQRVHPRLHVDAEEESSVHSSPTNDNPNDDLPPPPQWQHVPAPPCQYVSPLPPTYISAVGSGGPPPLSKKLNEVRNLGVTTFLGKKAAITANDWLDFVIDAFDDIELEDFDRVKIASRLLDEDAKAWWGRISGKFLALKQGEMSVSEYDIKLRRLFRHMPGANEDLLCTLFATSLTVDLQSLVSSLITDTTRTVPYSHLVDTTKQAARKTKQKSGVLSRFFKGKGKDKIQTLRLTHSQKRAIVRAHRMEAHLVALLVPRRHLGLANLPRGLILIISLQGEEVFARIAAVTTMDLARFPLSIFSAVVGITFIGIARIGRAHRIKQIGVAETFIRYLPSEILAESGERTEILVKTSW
ncbi:hypothetical protein COLO4_07603 [Corchorus olitorius]|uniref:Retrotransposon gag protein n=1 Tax=Corchorus olitorius TaxID=93759 RepID=A0A1R3KJ73_9ROSI|nr:hypothetical protein COLO4_07603 [Corchorus olitorius]